MEGPTPELTEEEWRYLLQLDGSSREWDFMALGQQAGYRPGKSEAIALKLQEQHFIRYGSGKVSITPLGERAIEWRKENYGDPLDERTYRGGHPGVPMMIVSDLSVSGDIKVPALPPPPIDRSIRQYPRGGEPKKTVVQKVGSWLWGITRYHALTWYEKVIIPVIAAALILIVSYYVIQLFRSHGIDLKPK